MNGLLRESLDLQDVRVTAPSGSKVSDDFQDFEDAALSPHGVIFVFWDVQGACNEKDCGLSSILKDMDDINKVYAFPPEAPQKYRGKAYSACNSTWGALCFNCATYPKSVGLPIPEDALPARMREANWHSFFSYLAYCTCCMACCLDHPRTLECCQGIWRRWLCCMALFADVTNQADGVQNLIAGLKDIGFFSKAVHLNSQ